MASGNHVKRGICADLPVHPRKSAKVISVIVVPPTSNRCGAASNTSVNTRLPVAWKIRNIAIRKPKSPIRFMMKAFLPALANARFSYQKPISK